MHEISRRGLVEEGKYVGHPACSCSHRKHSFVEGQVDEVAREESKEGGVLTDLRKAIAVEELLDERWVGARWTTKKWVSWKWVE